MQKPHQVLITEFIEQIWNKGYFEKLTDFIHPNYVDHSLPATFSADSEGLKKWILVTGQAFQHQTLIEDQVTEAHKSVVKIKMVMKHIGEWRGIPATNRQVSTIGFRFYRIEEGKIREHWALIDGNALENQLTEASKGCKVAT